jgi:hypothetical protein
MTTCAFCDPKNEDPIVLVMKIKDGEIPLGSKCYEIFNEKQIGWDESTRLKDIQKWFQSPRKRRLEHIDDPEFSLVIPKPPENAINGSTIPFFSKSKKSEEEIENEKMIKEVRRKVRRGRGRWFKKMKIRD